MPSDSPELDFDLEVVGTIDDDFIETLAQLLVDLAEAEEEAAVA